MRLDYGTDSKCISINLDDIIRVEAEGYNGYHDLVIYGKNIKGDDGDYFCIYLNCNAEPDLMGRAVKAFKDLIYEQKSNEPY